MFMWLEWIAMALGLLGTFFLGWYTRTIKVGWVLLMMGSLVCFWIFMHSGQYGFMTGSVIYAVLESIGLYRSFKK